MSFWVFSALPFSLQSGARRRPTAHGTSTVRLAFCTALPSTEKPLLTSASHVVAGRGNGARYDGTFRHDGVVGSCEGKTGSAATFSDEYKEYLAK